MSAVRPTFPRYVETAEMRANLREVIPGLYVGGATAVCNQPSPGRAWWAAVDAHGPEHAAFERREPAYDAVPVTLRCAFDDGAPVPVALLDAALALYAARRGDVLVSCSMGASRSVSVAYGIVRRLTGIDHIDALRLCAMPGGWPVPVTLRSAQRWVEGAPPDDAQDHPSLARTLAFLEDVYAYRDAPEAVQTGFVMMTLQPMLAAGRATECNDVLARADFARMSDAAIASVLQETLAARQLLPERAAFIARARVALAATRGVAQADELLRPFE